MQDEPYRDVTAPSPTQNDAELRALLRLAVEYLRKYGACDQYTGQPYDDVTEFLASHLLHEALDHG